ncbi:PHD-finger domain-containing protein [Plectosphaerella plurivora]|uniref:PHD-finger domain-containing protein n=1 Tax=Plectosphaerella plurivora TaxID=936078 RepID=A0A9P9AGQ6_9PEZI|nr:PHD-finger domain-containing protein [Plectosphaerella plurivora]
MAPLSPRRSSRARVNGVSQSQHNSSTSSLSSRGERNTRSLNKPASSKSTPTASLSSEPLDDFDDTLVTRRRTRGQEEIRDKIRADPYNMPADDDIQEDDESVRCICGFEEYPGPPPFEDESKHGKPNPEAEFFASIELSDEVSGLFVQCDVCKVWQHGACVGIFTEESSPDEYFCEKCRKDLHKIHTANNGQRYSNYVPLGRASQTSSRATSVTKDTPRSPKEQSARSVRAGSANHPSKRRSTMNSRDAAYDEEEQLRRAIQASKEQTSPELGDPPIRRPKRGRSDSDEDASNLKRQRTSSPSLSPPTSKTMIEEDTDDEGALRNGSKKNRSTRTHREKSEREDRDRARAENASKRKGRADRRRAEDSDPSEEIPLAATRAVVKQSTEVPPPPEPTPSSAPTPDPTPTAPVPPGSTHKKTARSHHKRGKGRNQYTKDRDDQEGSPARSMSRDTPRQTEEQASTNTKAAATDSTTKPTKKASLHSKVSMSDMKRRVAAFLDFISKTQIEMAGESSSGSQGSHSSSQNHSPRNGPQININGATPTKDVNGVPAINGASPDGQAQAEGQGFKDLNCVEMMDSLTRDLLKWQNQYAH